MKTNFVLPRRGESIASLIAGCVAALLPFAVTLSPEKALAAHLMGLVIAALAAKSLWRAGANDGVLLTGAGILAIVVPVFAWQMPVGAAWALPLLGAITAAAGLRHVLRSDGLDHATPVRDTPSAPEH